MERSQQGDVRISVLTQGTASAEASGICLLSLFKEQKRRPVCPDHGGQGMGVRDETGEGVTLQSFGVRSLGLV